MKSILVLFALAFGGPVLMAASLTDPNAAALRDAAAWTLMLAGIGVTGLALRMERKGGALHTMRVLRPSQ